MACGLRREDCNKHHILAIDNILCRFKQISEIHLVPFQLLYNLSWLLQFARILQTQTLRKAPESNNYHAEFKGINTWKKMFKDLIKKEHVYTAKDIILVSSSNVIRWR